VQIAAPDMTRRSIVQVFAGNAVRNLKPAQIATITRRVQRMIVVNL
jgi:hypothetical protein